jgi:hypothetical protein
MRMQLHAQMDLFIARTRPAEISGPEREKAVALLQALLREAATKPASKRSTNNEKGAGNE